TKIAFSAFRRGSLDIHTMNANGSDQRNVTANSLGNESPAWSPDGSKIAFVRGVPPYFFGYDIYVMNADGSGERALTAGADIDFFPSWSPDGRRLAFYRNGWIWVMNADGTGSSNLTSQWWDSSPTWSPDGARIAFANETPDY